MLKTIFAVLLCMWACSCGPTSAPPAEKSAETATPTAPPTAPPPTTASIYENKLVRRPGTAIEDGKVYLVHNGTKRWIVNTSWFASNGFKFPGDVHQIPAAELDAIPTGDPIK
jgi:hypothetical protein